MYIVTQTSYFQICILFIVLILLNTKVLTSPINKENNCLIPNPFSADNFDLSIRVAARDFWHLRVDLGLIRDVVEPLALNNSLDKGTSENGFVDIYLSVCHPLNSPLSNLDSECNTHRNRTSRFASKSICLEREALSKCPLNSAVCGILETDTGKIGINLGSYFFSEKIATYKPTYFPPPLVDMNVEVREESVSFQPPQKEFHSANANSDGVEVTVPNLPKFSGKDMTVHYRNGIKCLTTNFSTVVSFKCANDDFLLLVPTAQRCQLEFNLMTRDACGNETVSTDSCQPINPEKGSPISFASLWSLNGTFVSAPDARLLLNICGPLRKELCDGIAGVTACLFNGSEVVVVSRNDGPVIREKNGSYMLWKENGDECSVPGLRYSAKITFRCTPEVRSNLPPTISHFDQKTCSFSLDWPTALACERETRCSVSFGNGHFDLSNLKAKKAGKVQIDSSSPEIFIRACQVLESPYGCTDQGGVCLRNSLQNISLGQPRRDLYVDSDGNPTLFYNHGSPCPFGQRRRFSSFIRFYCIDNATQEKIKETKAMDECTFNFGWWTPEACLKVPNESSCYFIDATSKTSQNFSSLERPGGYALKDFANNRTLILNICKPLRVSHFDSKQSAAIAIESDDTMTSAGISSAHVFSRDGLPTLEYIAVSGCDRGMHITTTLTFMCTAKSADEQFYKMIYDENTCTYKVIWYTELACQPKHDCSIGLKDGHHFDFQELRRPLGKYNLFVELESQPHSIILNLCQPVPPTFNCPLGSAACLVNKKTNNSRSLGFFHSAITGGHREDQPLSLIYTGGSPCDGKTPDGSRFSSRIIFVCGQGEGIPKFKRQLNCQFTFEWSTKFACPQGRNSENKMAAHGKNFANVADVVELKSEVMDEDEAPGRNVHVAKTTREGKRPESRSMKNSFDTESLLDNSDMNIERKIPSSDSVTTSKPMGGDISTAGRNQQILSNLKGLGSNGTQIAAEFDTLKDKNKNWSELLPLLNPHVAKPEGNENESKALDPESTTVRPTPIPKTTSSPVIGESTLFPIWAYGAIGAGILVTIVVCIGILTLCVTKNRKKKHDVYPKFAT